MISTRNLDALSNIDTLKRTFQSMAMLDAILYREWDGRYYSYNSRWSRGKEMASMRNGSGDGYFALFNSHGCFLKGFGHESLMTPFRMQPPQVWPGILDTVPPEFVAQLREPAFSMEETTFCIWRRYADSAWQLGPVKFPEGLDPDGSAYLLSPLDGKAETYRDWAQDYYEREIDMAAVQDIYNHRPLTQSLVDQINSDVSLNDLAEDLQEIGYPSNYR